MVPNALHNHVIISNNKCGFSYISVSGKVITAAIVNLKMQNIQ